MGDHDAALGHTTGVLLIVVVVAGVTKWSEAKEKLEEHHSKRPHV
jgi:hypothetical protein